MVTVLLSVISVQTLWARSHHWHCLGINPRWKQREMQMQAPHRKEAQVLAPTRIQAHVLLTVRQQHEPLLFNAAQIKDEELRSLRNRGIIQHQRKRQNCQQSSISKVLPILSGWDNIDFVSKIDDSSVPREDKLELNFLKKGVMFKGKKKPTRVVDVWWWRWTTSWAKNLRKKVGSS